MTVLRITSNNRMRPLLTIRDLTPAEREDFDYITPVDADGDSWDEERFVRAYGQVFDVQEFESISGGISVLVVAPEPGQRDLLAQWDAIQPGSAWHALVLRYGNPDSADYGMRVAVGWAQW